MFWLGIAADIPEIVSNCNTSRPTNNRRSHWCLMWYLALPGWKSAWTLGMFRRSLTQPKVNPCCLWCASGDCSRQHAFQASTATWWLSLHHTGVSGFQDHWDSWEICTDYQTVPEKNSWLWWGYALWIWHTDKSPDWPIFQPGWHALWQTLPFTLSNLHLAAVNACEKLPNRQEVYKASYVNSVTSMEPLAVETMWWWG